MNAEDIFLARLFEVGLDDGAAVFLCAGGVQAQRPALFAGRVEEGDVRHRAGEVAAAQAGGGGDEAEDPVRRVGVGHREREAEGGDQQQAVGEGTKAPRTRSMKLLPWQQTSLSQREGSR